MFKILGAHFRKVKSGLKKQFAEIAGAIENGDTERRNAAIWSLIGSLLPRLLIWGAGAVYYAKKGLAGGYFELVVTFYALGFLLSGEAPALPASPNVSDTETDCELIRQRAAEMQDTVMDFMYRVLVAVSPNTPILRPLDVRSIEKSSASGESFYLDGDIVIYQAEAETEGEITSEIENDIRNRIQHEALKYIRDYPMLISPESGGRAPVEVLSVKNLGRSVLIDFVFTSKASIPIIDARRRARVERQQREQRQRAYIDEDYGE